MLAVGRGEHRAAAGREDDAFDSGELGDRLGFAAAKARFALDLENHGNLYPAAALDLVVRVDETQLEPAREQPPDRGLAGPHQAYQVDIRVDVRLGARAGRGACGHSRIVETKTAGRARPSYRSAKNKPRQVAAVSEY